MVLPFLSMIQTMSSQRTDSRRWEYDWTTTSVENVLILDDDGGSGKDETSDEVVRRKMRAAMMVEKSNLIVLNSIVNVSAEGYLILGV